MYIHTLNKIWTIYITFELLFWEIEIPLNRIVICKQPIHVCLKISFLCRWLVEAAHHPSLSESSRSREYLQFLDVVTIQFGLKLRTSESFIIIIWEHYQSLRFSNNSWAATPAAGDWSSFASSTHLANGMGMADELKILSYATLSIREGIWKHIQRSIAAATLFQKAIVLVLIKSF